MPAATAVAAARPALGHKGLAMKSHTSFATVAGSRKNFDFVDEHENKKGEVDDLAVKSFLTEPSCSRLCCCHQLARCSPGGWLCQTPLSHRPEQRASSPVLCRHCCLQRTWCRAAAPECCRPLRIRRRNVLRPAA